METGKLKTVDGEKRSVRLAAVCAAVCCCLLYGWFCLSVRYGVGVPDEAFYLTIPQRLLQGDRMLLEEWHLSQFTAVFQLLPYAVYTKLAGGTEGIVLCMRYVYLAMSFTSFWYIFIKLRKTPWRALLCAFCFCVFVPFAVFEPNYYTIPVFFLLVSCLVFSKEAARPSGLRLFFAGVLFACAVLITPGLTLFYIVYTALALVRLIAQKKGRRWLADWDFVLERRVWLYVFFGVLASAVVFTGYLQLSSGFGEIVENLPNLLSDSEYDVSAGGNVRGFLLQKIRVLFDYFGFTAVLFPLVSAGSVIALRCKALRRRLFAVKLLFAALHAVLFSVSLFLLLRKRGDDSILFHSILPVPLFCFGAACYVLCEAKNRRLFLLWWCGLAFSLAKDTLSDISVGFGCVLGAVPAAWHLLQLTGEISAELRTAPQTRKRGAAAKKRTPLRVWGAVSVCILAAVVLWDGFIAFDEGWKCHYEEELHPFAAEGAAQVREGPYRGLIVTQASADICAGMLADLTLIRETQSGPVYVSALAPWCYLYLDGPGAAYSSWWIKEDAAVRQLAYWRLYPERLPSVIYVPDYAVNMKAPEYNGAPVEQLKTCCRWEARRGEAGTIYLVSDWAL